MTDLRVFAITTPLSAGFEPKATVRLFEEVGSKFGGVKAVATPAKATLIREKNILKLTVNERIFRLTQRT